MYKCTVIKGHVMEELKFGFNSHDIPVRLVNNTSPNDACASLYFRQNGGNLEIYSDTSKNDIFRSDDVKDLIVYFHS